MSSTGQGGQPAMGKMISMSGWGGGHQPQPGSVLNLNIKHH